MNGYLPLTGVPPFTRTLPFLGAATAYQAQSLGVDRRIGAGERVIGAKLGMTSAVKRRALGIDEPVHGRLTSGMILPYGEPVRLAELIHPRAEPEIAFVTGRTLTGCPTVDEVLRATDRTYAIYAHRYPNNPHSDSERDTNVNPETGKVCVAEGKEPETPEQALAIAQHWCTGYVEFMQSGAFPNGPARVRV